VGVCLLGELARTNPPTHPPPPPPPGGLGCWHLPPPLDRRPPEPPKCPRLPWFCVSIALEIDGEVRLGVIYHPVLDELFTAVKGEGAFVNGRPIRVSGRHPLKQCLLATGFPYDRTPDNENNFANFFSFQFAARAVRRAGAAALDLAYVVAGRLDGYWELKLKPWDVAAGQLLVTEAGGRVTNHAGEPFAIDDHRILASNGIVHREMLEILGCEAR